MTGIISDEAIDMLMALSTGEVAKRAAKKYPGMAEQFGIMRPGSPAKQVDSDNDGDNDTVLHDESAEPAHAEPDDRFQSGDMVSNSMFGGSYGEVEE
jgi:hypothetical protein